LRIQRNDVEIWQEAEYMASRWGAMTVGPTLPSAFLDKSNPDDASYDFNIHAPMTAECRAWLDERPARSVVFVSFGSLATPSLDQVAEVAEGLYNSGKAFLWVVRAPETWKIPKTFAEKAKGRGLMVTWCAQLEVLAHDAVGCFVTHCGWNSVLEGLGIGVPMVAIPQWSDQPMNAKYIQDVWRVGVRVRRDVEGMVMRKEVARCVMEVMEGDMSKEYMKNAASWSEKAKSAMRAGGSSDNNIVEFLNKLELN
jgi:pathogen-inducible salicylic acid glucosyltransferase